MVRGELDVDSQAISDFGGSAVQTAAAPGNLARAATTMALGAKESNGAHVKEGDS